MRDTRRDTLRMLGTAVGLSAVPAVAARQRKSSALAESIHISRETTVVGSPVTVTGPAGVTWSLHQSPPDSDATLYDPERPTTSLRPDASGRYAITAWYDGATERVSFRADDRAAIFDRYAPKVFFHADTHYRPTRIEAMLEHAELRRTDEPADHPRRRRWVRGVHRRTEAHRCGYWGSVARHGVSPRRPRFSHPSRTVGRRGKTVCRLRKTYFTAKRRLQKRGSKRIVDSFGDDLWEQIDDVFHRVTGEVVEYAESVENPVLVLEDLTYIRESMDCGEYMNRRLHGWGFAKLHAQIRY